ncbi:MAG: FAD:protein FMN transferase [Chloroflexi bacterium]|nr:FAD:protein FMN transferase [Chloroflexota bacterium]
MAQATPVADAVQTRLYRIQFRAMGCHMSAWAATEDGEVASRTLAAVWAFFGVAERVLSRFRPDSELSRLNARAGQQVEVSPLLWSVLQAALEGARCTSGLYDPTILGALEAAGYDRTFADVADDGTAGAPVPARAGWREIRTDVPSRAVLLPPGARIDLGGIAKGWAADQALEMLSLLGPCLVDAGGDIAARGRPLEQPAWPVGIADPRRPEEDIGLLRLRDCGVATSGMDYRRWRRGGQVQHHIIDPRTGRPANADLLSVTVVAPNAAQAELHAKAVLVLGSRQGYKYLARQTAVEALLVHQDGAVLWTPGFRRYLADA